MFVSARPAGDIKENNHNIILKTNHEIAKLRGLDIDDEYCGRDDGIGLLVDELGDVVEIDESQIDPRPANVDEMEGRFFFRGYSIEKRSAGVITDAGNPERRSLNL